MRYAVLVGLVLLGGCSREPVTPTAEENRQLDDVEQMLNEAPANLESVQDFGLGNNQAAVEDQP